VTFDLNNDEPVFWEQMSTNDLNGHFAVDLGNTHTYSWSSPRTVAFEIHEYL
jgi:hypothetical protein